MFQLFRIVAGRTIPRRLLLQPLNQPAEIRRRILLRRELSRNRRDARQQHIIAVNLRVEKGDPLLPRLPLLVDVALFPSVRAMRVDRLHGGSVEAAQTRTE